MAKIRSSEIGDVGDVAGDLVAADLPAGPQGITENVVSAVKAARNGPRM